MECPVCKHEITKADFQYSKTPNNDWNAFKKRLFEAKEALRKYDKRQAKGVS